jgi:predicted ATPase/DNA-binding XRE family transcriptional regulator
MKTSERTYSFGYWLRRYRKAHDFTQIRLADLAGCSRAMLRKIECDERRPSLLLAERFADVFGLNEVQRNQFLAVARQLRMVDSLALPTVPLPGQPAKTNMPAVDPHVPIPATSLIGRESDMSRIENLVRAKRCVTLVGAGGIGKTRLAIAIAQALQAEFVDGCWFIELAHVTQPEQLLAVIAHTLGLRGDTDPLMYLQRRLQNHKLLLILDNFEHLLPAAEYIGQLLAHTHTLHLLITSRAGLRIRAEQRYEIQPLQPQPAVAMFIERYLAARPGYRLSAADQQAISEIVRHLDGLPLAIELAAARGHALTPQALQARLYNRLQLLIDGPRDLPARQRTLREVVGWSYNLIDPTVQQTCMVIAAFTGSFTTAAVEAIENTQGTGDRLAILLEHHLIQHLHIQSERYMMLETIAEYAVEALINTGCEPIIRSRHAYWYCSFAEQAQIGMRGAARLEWMERLELEFQNMQGALRWAITERHDPEAGLMAASKLSQYWHVRGHHRVGRAWLQQAMPLIEPNTLAYALALLADGSLAWFQRDFVAAQTQLSEAVQRLAVFQEQSSSIEALMMLAVGTSRLHQNSGDALRLASQATELAAQVGTAWDLGSAYFWQGVIAADAKEYSLAKVCAQKSIVLFEAAGDIWNSGPHSILGDLALLAGDDTIAHHHYTSALYGFRAIGDVWGCAFSLRTLAEIALRNRDHAAAHAMAHESFSYWQALGDIKAAQRVFRLIEAIEAVQGQAIAS